MILCIGATPAIQRVMVFCRLTLGAVNRAHVTLDGVAGKSINVAKVLQALDQAPVAVGFVGGERGEEARRRLEAMRIETEFVTVAAPTRQCVTVIDEAAGTITELIEESQPATAADYKKLSAVVHRRLRAQPGAAAGAQSCSSARASRQHRAERSRNAGCAPAAVPGCRAVIMSGTLTPGAPVDFYPRCAESAQAAGALTVVDAQGPPLLETLKVRPGLVKPNRGELAATLGRQLKGRRALVEAMRELRERGAQRVVVTAGKEPALAFDGRTFWRVSPPSVAAVNPIGSGDAFTAGLVWRLVGGDDLGEACRWAAAAGAANALSLMPGELDPAEVHRLASEVRVERL